MLPCAGGLFKPVWGMPHTGFFGELDGRHAAMSGMRPVVIVVVFQAASAVLACDSDENSASFRRPLKLSTKTFWVSLPGAM